MVVNSPIMIGDMFQSLGVPVHFSVIDCDDTIAAFAYHLSGSILSQDADFFRYFVESSRETAPPYRVFSDFEMRNGKLSLKNHPGPKPGKPRASRRKILATLPETRGNPYFISNIPDYEEKPPGVDLQLLRGCGSNLTQETNPHLQARPLRQALYWRMNYGPVREKLAHWDPGTGATFIEEIVEPDNSLDTLLDSPREAFQEIFGDSRRSKEMSEIKWRTHVFSQKSVIAELCAWSNPSRGILEILWDI